MAFHNVQSLGGGLYKVNYTKMAVDVNGNAIEIKDYSEDVSLEQLSSQLTDWTNRKTDAELNISRIQNIVDSIRAI